MHSTVSLSEFWSNVPQRNVELLNRVGPTGDTELDRRASDKTHEEFALGLMDGPYISLEECPGQHKVLVRRKPRWQGGDVRNIDDCSENGINETFESNETYKPAGVDHHVSPIKQWEASLPGVKLHGFVADLWKHFRQIGIGLNLVVVFWCHNSGTRLRGCPFGAAACVQGCARLPMAICALLQHHLLVPVQHYQDDHHCVEPSYSVAQAWTLIKRFYGLLGPKLATPGCDKYPLPSQVYRLLGTKVDLIASPREIQSPSLENRFHQLRAQPDPFRPRNWVKVTLLRSLVNSVSQQDNCLIDLGACIWPFKLRQYGKNGCSQLTAEIARAIAF